MFKHGIFSSDVPTSIVPPAQTSAGMPVVFGTAPIHLSGSTGTNGCGPTNLPVLANVNGDAVTALGYSDEWKKYTLCEFMYSHFQLFNVAPVVFINVLDPAKHSKTLKDQAVTLALGNGTIGSASLGPDIILSSIIVKLTQVGQPLVLGTDYTTAYDASGNAVITRNKNGAIVTDTATLSVSFTQLDPTMVTSADIIGGVDAATGKLSGLELINQVFPRFRMPPGQLVAPHWSTKPEVAAVMEAKAAAINGVFKCIALCDAPTDTLLKYQDVPAWKNQNNYVFNRQTLCWPRVKLGSRIFHMSTQQAGLNCLVDSTNDDVPYESSSNKNLQMDGLCLEDGTEVILDLTMANYLNSQGITTALNFIGGWRLWGNMTAAFPASTDPKDAFLCIRRMFDWQANTFLLTYWQKVDKPLNRVLVETFVNSENLRLNGLTARGFLLGGRMKLLQTENPVTDLMNSTIRFHTYMTPPTPAQDIEDQLEFDPQYLKTLFG